MPRVPNTERNSHLRRGKTKRMRFSDQFGQRLGVNRTPLIGLEKAGMLGLSEAALGKKML